MDRAAAKALQVSLNRFFRRYGLGQPPLAADGQVGPQTEHAVVVAKYFLGYGRPQRHDGTIKSAFVRRLRHPHSPRYSTPAMLAVGARRRVARRHELAQTPLRVRALHVANTLVGVMEHGGNNVGPVVSRLIRENGGIPGEPWCGDFVAYCYRHAGSRTVSRSWAAARLTGGAHHVATPRPGDAVYYTFDHVGLYVRDLGGGQIETIEGNTGPVGAVSDSSTGGDGVYRKHRSKGLVSHYTRIDG